jgi:uncharacterized protein with ATP-grasp and redox domains
MKTHLDCIPCFMRQALEASRFVTEDITIHETVLRELLRMTADLDFSECPPAVGQKIHRRLRQITGDADPYRKAKMRFNHMALEMLPELAEEVRASIDPLFHALRIAIAGNVIDLGIAGSDNEDIIRKAIHNKLNEPFFGNTEDFRTSIQEAHSILYLTDNAGEIVFDRLLIELLPVEQVTVAVRGAPVLNDATQEDAEIAGLYSLVNVIDNGSDAPGTILSDCSEDFRKAFSKSDLIIAKGQGNYETLSDTEGNIFFLLKAKCPVIASDIGLPVGMYIASRGKLLPSRLAA